MGGWFSSAEDDRTFTDQTENQKVTKIQKMSVPADISNGLVSHEGVKVTVESGKDYMVHKVGKPNDVDLKTATVVQDTSDPKLHIQDWKPSGLFGSSFSVEDRNLKVGHFVEESGKGYNVAFDNCKHAANRMEDLHKPKWIRHLEWMDRYT